jgi:uncharacterized damage-inducible protein DinB
MIIEYIQTLYNYNSWANGRVLDATAQLTPEQFLESVEASFASVRDTLVHTMNGQWIWLSRWQGISPRSLFNPAEFPDVTAIRSRWDKIEADSRAFVDRLDQAKLGQIIHYENTTGEPYAFPLWQLMVHQVNHATQHRSEVAVILTQFGHSPGELDLIRYLNLERT